MRSVRIMVAHICSSFVPHLDVEIVASGESVYVDKQEVSPDGSEMLTKELILSTRSNFVGDVEVKKGPFGEGKKLSCSRKQKRKVWITSWEEKRSVLRSKSSHHVKN